MSSGKAAQYFGDYFKVLKAISSKTLPGQFKRTFKTNSYKRQFQTSIGIVKLEGVHNMKIKVSNAQVNYIVR